MSRPLTQSHAPDVKDLRKSKMYNILMTHNCTIKQYLNKCKTILYVFLFSILCIIKKCCCSIISVRVFLAFYLLLQLVLWVFLFVCIIFLLQVQWKVNSTLWIFKKVSTNWWTTATPKWPHRPAPYWPFLATPAKPAAASGFIRSMNLCRFDLNLSRQHRYCYWTLKCHLYCNK